MLNPLAYIKSYYEYKTLNHNISKDKHEQTDNLLKNYKKMSKAEIVNHLDFILGYSIDTKNIDRFLGVYKDPILALKIYKKCHFLIDKKLKRIKKHKLKLSENLMIIIYFPLAILLFVFGITSFIEQEFWTEWIPKSFYISIVLLIFSYSLMWSIVDTLVKVDLANRFEELEKIVKIDAKDNLK